MGFEKHLIYLSPKDLLPPDLRQDGRDRYRMLLLSESIRQYGLFSPVIVRRMGRGYTLIDGVSRTAAATLAGVGKIPCLVYVGSDPLLMKTALQVSLLQKNLLSVASGLSHLLSRYSPELAACALSLSTKELLCLSAFDLMDEGLKGKMLTLTSPLFTAGRLCDMTREERRAFAEKIELAYKSEPVCEKPPTPHTKTPCVKDPRFYINSIRKIADRMSDNGLSATVKQRETAGYTEITLRISKKAVDQPQLSLLG